MRRRGGACPSAQVRLLCGIQCVPHFAHPARLLARLSACLSPGGRLTVAHGMSLAALHRHHAGAARGVSRPMLEPERLAALMPPCLAVDVAVSDTEKYVVSARLR